jgi:hypothetical protein
MSKPTIQATLTAEEWRLVSTLREIPPSPLKLRVGTLLEELIAFVQEPRCAEMQADGVPCDSVTAQCDQCVHVAEMLETMDRVSSLK